MSEEIGASEAGQTAEKPKRTRRAARIYGGVFVESANGFPVFEVVPGWPAVTTKRAARKWCEDNDAKLGGPIELVKVIGKITPARQVTMRLE